MEKVNIDGKEYEVIKNYSDALNISDLEGIITDYFDSFDYILGDYSYGKIRLKGFYDSSNKKAIKLNDIKYLERYIKEYCSIGAKTFLLKKEKNLKNSKNM